MELIYIASLTILGVLSREEDTDDGDGFYYSYNWDCRNHGEGALCEAFADGKCIMVKDYIQNKKVYHCSTKNG